MLGGGKQKWIWKQKKKIKFWNTYSAFVSVLHLEQSPKISVSSWVVKEVPARREELNQNAVFTRVCRFELNYLSVVVKFLILCKKIKIATSFVTGSIQFNPSLRFSPSPMNLLNYGQRPFGGLLWPSEVGDSSGTLGWTPALCQEE